MASPPSPAPEIVLAVRDVHTQLGGAVVQDGVTLDVRRGKIFALAGPSGCGKTLLLRQTLALQPPDSGSIHLLGRDVVGLGDEDALALRRRCGVVFERAALFIYLNHTCYNGLYRVNSRGLFNVPAGRYTRPRISDPTGLREASSALAGARLVTRRFDACTAEVERDDFAYVDPPYHRLHAGSFTSYTAGGFGEAEQRELARVVDRLHAAGCRVMVSNSDTPLVRELYGAYRIVPIRAARAINSAPGGRGPIDEVLILNYDPARRPD